MQIMENRAFNLLKYILNEPQLSVDSVISRLDCTKRQLGYDLDKINDLLQEKNIDPIIINRKKIVLPEKTKKEILAMDLSQNHFIVSGENRIWMICIMLFCAKEPLSMVHITTALKSSKNTVLSDFKKLSSITEDYGVKISYTRSLGYHFQGDAKNIRTVVLFVLASLKENYFCKEIITAALEDSSYPQHFQQIKTTIDNFIHDFSLPVIHSYVDQTIYFISLLYYHCNSIHYKPAVFNESLWLHLPLYLATTSLYENLPTPLHDQEKMYLFILLLSMTLGDDIYFQIYNKESVMLKNLSQDLVDRFEVITGFTFTDKTAVSKNILMHIQPAYFRLKYGIPVINPILEQIKRDYGEIFAICRLVLEPFSDYLNCFIPDDEVAYIAIHFLAMLDSYDPVTMRTRAVIICQNGLATSIMVKNQLMKIFPEIAFLDTYTVEEFKKLPADAFDIVFSTFKLTVPPPKQLFIVPPIITVAEKFSIIEEVHSNVFGLKSKKVTANNILQIVSQYAQIMDYESLAQELNRLLGNSDQTERKDELPMLKDLLTPGRIRFHKKVENWEEAFCLAAAPLLDEGCIEQEYIDSMIENVKKFGPYVVICPYIAIPHATNKSGVNQIGMSYLRLEEETLILDNPEKPVKLLICLAAIDNTTHLKALAELTAILGEADSREKLLASTTVEEVLQQIS